MQTFSQCPVCLEAESPLTYLYSRDLQFYSLQSKLTGPALAQHAQVKLLYSCFWKIVVQAQNASGSCGSCDIAVITCAAGVISSIKVDVPVCADQIYRRTELVENIV